MRNSHFHQRHLARGISLIEVMVAMVIGLLATVLVMQLFNDSEKRNRTAMGSADAQSNGVLTFYQLQSQIQRAGYGMNSVNLFNCKLKWKVASGNYISVPVHIAPVTINPVSITAGTSTTVIPAGDANTDTLLIMYGNGNGEPQGNTVIAYTAPIYTMQMPSAFAKGDRVIATGDTCATDLIVDRVTAVGSTSVTTAVGAAGTVLFNLGPGLDSENAAPTVAAPNNGPSIWAYAIRNGNLTVCDFNVNDCSLDANKGDSTVWVPVASNIVSLRAVYWKDTGTYVNGALTSTSHDGIPDANGYDQTQPTASCDWVHIPSINLAIVSRSEDMVHNPEDPDSEIVTITTNDIGRTIGNRTLKAPANAPAWRLAASSAVASLNSTVAPIVSTTGWLGPDTSANENWKRYRYKTFEATIPLRNVSWLTAAPVPPASGAASVITSTNPCP